MPDASTRRFVDAFTRHGRTLWVIAAAWVGHGEAADLVQEAAKVAWQRRHQLRDGNDERRWLMQVVRTVGANWRRRRRPELREPERFDELAAARDRIEVEGWRGFDADRAGLSDELARALARVPEVARACLLLQVLQGASCADIGALFEMSENTVASHVRRARLQLREALSDRAPASGSAQELS